MKEKMKRVRLFQGNEFQNPRERIKICIEIVFAFRKKEREREFEKLDN